MLYRLSYWPSSCRPGACSVEVRAGYGTTAEASCAPLSARETPAADENSRLTR